MKTIFITGTDTNIGKTTVCCLLLQQFIKLGYQTFGIKPLSTGCQYNQKGFLENKDALLLQQSASFYQPYAIVNPIALQDPVAPHLAAANVGLKLSKELVKKCMINSIQSKVDINIIEGVGGWSIPLNYHELLSEVVAELSIPVILVVGIKLGCLNHAILSYNNIVSMRVPFIGWVANCLVEDSLLIQENIQTLQQWIKKPCLGVVPYGNTSSSSYQNSINLNIDLIRNFLV